MIKLERKTRETEINLSFNLYGSGNYNIETGVGFFDHMLELMAGHGFFDLELTVKGDLDVDAHHTVEDTALVLGQALAGELGDKAGIKRFADVVIPMEESLVLVAIDISGRSYFAHDLEFTTDRLGDFPMELFTEFFNSLCRNAGLNLHFRMYRGGNNHHLIEACFKGFGRVLDQATKQEKRLVGKPLSTKGILEGVKNDNSD